MEFMRIAALSLTVLLGAPLLAGCTTCVSGDLDCVMTHLSVSLDGNSIDLVRVPADRVTPGQPMSTSSGPSSDSLQLRITPLSAPNFGDPIAMIQSGVSARRGTGVGSTAAAPSITNKLSDISLSSDKEVALAIAFDDPNGMTPTFCFQPCKADGTWCYPHWVYCAHPIRDNQLNGVSLFTFRPSATFERPFIPGVPTLIEPTPVEPTPIGPSVIHPTPVSGQTIPIAIQFPTPAVANPGGGPGNFNQCQNAPSVCGGGVTLCNIEACASSDGSGCTGGYKTSDGGWFPCASCSNCTSAAMAAVGHCCPPPK